MADNPRTKTTPDTDTTASGTGTTSSECRSGMMGCGMGKQGIKGMLLMAACCGAPLLLLLALPLIGSAMGSLGVSALSTLALLACPVGMALMMWLMMRGQQAGAPVAPQAAAGLQASSEAAEGIVRSTSLEPEAADGLPHRGNGRQTTLPQLATDGHQEVEPTPADSRTKTAPSPGE